MEKEMDNDMASRVRSETIEYMSCKILNDDQYCGPRSLYNYSIGYFGKISH